MVATTGSSGFSVASAVVGISVVSAVGLLVVSGTGASLITSTSISGSVVSLESSPSSFSDMVGSLVSSSSEEEVVMAGSSVVSTVVGASVEGFPVATGPLGNTKVTGSSGFPVLDSGGGTSVVASSGFSLAAAGKTGKNGSLTGSSGLVVEASANVVTGMMIGDSSVVAGGSVAAAGAGASVDACVPSLPSASPLTVMETVAAPASSVVVGRSISEPAWIITVVIVCGSSVSMTIVASEAVGDSVAGGLTGVAVPMLGLVACDAAASGEEAPDPGVTVVSSSAESPLPAGRSG